jgi:hypothetical protein
MKNFNVEVFIKDLDKLFNDMQDKAIAGSENVATASWVIKQQQAEIEVLKKRYEPKIVDMCLRTDEQGRVLPQREIE